MRMMQFLVVVLLCMAIGLLCDRFGVNQYLKWLLMALPSIIWIKLRNPTKG